MKLLVVQNRLLVAVYTVYIYCSHTFIYIMIQNLDITRQIKKILHYKSTMFGSKKTLKHLCFCSQVKKVLALKLYLFLPLEYLHLYWNRNFLYVFYFALFFLFVFLYIINIILVSNLFCFQKTATKKI